MMSSDPYDLDRFVTAQAPVFDIVLDELKAGRKRSHWMWFVFPQLQQLGHSPTAKFYGIASIEEARAYLGHPLLGPRLRLATEAALASGEGSLHKIFGSPDDFKFRSSMTLFSIASPGPDNGFDSALERFSDGHLDERTLALLKGRHVD